MATQIELQKQLNVYKKKRIWFLFFLLMWIVFIVVTFILLNQYLTTNDTSVLVLFIKLILFMVWFYLFVPLFQQHSMHYFYYSMLVDDVQEKRASIQHHPETVVDQLTKQGFTLQIDRSNYAIYTYLGNYKHPFIKQGLTFAVIISDLKTPFYSDDIESDLNKIKDKVFQKTRINKEFIVQIRTYRGLKQEDKDQLNRIISYKVQRHALIHLNVGFDVLKQTYYVLRPVKRYPNREYYQLVQWIDSLYKGETHG